MKKNRTSLIIWLISGITGLAIFILFFNHAFPVASIDLRLSKKELLEKASGFIARQGFSLKGFDRALVFDSDYYASVYLQKTQGIKKSNKLIREGIPVWFWNVRWFKELEKEGFFVALDPATGEIVGFNYSVLDDAEGKKLSLAQARRIAEEKIALQGLDLNDYELKDSSTTEQKNRTDYYFDWQRKNYEIDEANLRLSVSIYGDKLGSFNRYLKVPEEFIRDLRKEVSFGQVLSMISLIFMFLLIIAAIFVLIVQFKKDEVNWKFGLVWGVIVSALSLVAFLNSISLLWSSYPNTMSKAVFIALSSGSTLIGALLLGLIIFLFGASGESLWRVEQGAKLPCLEALRTKKVSVFDVIPIVVVGYSLGFIFLGYVTLFYLIGGEFFNIWMPPEVEYSNILSTGMPFLFPLTIAISAAVSEEFMFRLFSISFFKKYIKLTWLCILIPAVIWAFGHSNYPVFPVYVRGIELSIAGIVFGIVFLKYGLESVLIGHFVINAALVGLPLLKSHNTYFVISGLIVIAIALIPLLVMVIMARNRIKVR